MGQDPAQERDERLAVRAAAGDRAAFEILVTRHRGAVYRLCWAATGNHADADDAAQETFLRLHRAVRSYDPRRPFLPWLRRIAWNCGLSVRRDRQAGVFPAAPGEPVPEAADPAEGPDAAAAANEERRRVAAAMAALPAEFRTVLVMRAVEGLSYAEIAEVAGIPAGTVMSRLSRARERLMGALKARA